MWIVIRYSEGPLTLNLTYPNPTNHNPTISALDLHNPNPNSNSNLRN